MTRDTEVLAAEYVLGTLEADAREQFARDLAGDATLQALVADWERRLSTLDEAVAPVEPREELWHAIEAGLDEGGLPGTVTLRAAEGEWKPYRAGLEKKLLYLDRDAGMQTFLMRFTPGARLTGHGHAALEECFVIEGDLSIGELRLNPGDFHAVLPGSPHPDLTSKNGAVVYVRGEIRENIA